uniref:Protein kinase domain-containing protein n=1 Tax=Meloidogyne hapla TaxID=6305 RepID=A0A1I8B5N1_MELHA
MSSSKEEINQNYCWQAENTNRSNESPSPSFTQIRPFSASVCCRPSPRRSAPTTKTISTLGSPRPNRQSIGNHSPLHVVELFARTARAAIGSATGSDSGLIRDESVRLFMNSDEVFKAWEENMKINSEEELGKIEKNSTKHSVTFPTLNNGGQGVRKNASLHEKSNETKSGTKTTRSKKMQRTLSTNIISNEIEKEDNEDETEPQRSPAEIKKFRSLSQNQKIIINEDDYIEDRQRYNINNSSDTFGTALEIKKVSLENDYRIIGGKINDGKFGNTIAIKQIIAEHQQSRQQIALKLYARPQTKLTDDESAFFLVQEPIICNSQTLRDLLNANPGGLGESATKSILSKILAALEFIHSECLVHRAIRAENILIGDPGKFTRVKLTEFGKVRPVDSIIRHVELVGSYHSPELCERVPNETYSVTKQTDIWAFGILIAYCIKGKFPWQKATIMCKPFYEWDQWLKRKAVQQPKYWDSFPDKAMRMFKHSLNPKPKGRWDVKEMRKFIEKERLSKNKNSSDDAVYYPDEGVGTKMLEISGKQSKKTSTIGQCKACILKG